MPDRNRSIADFLGPYVQVASAYFGRRFDTIVLENALGTNYAKVSGATSESSVAFPASQQVINALSGSDEGLTLAKLIETKSILGQNETPMGEQKYFVHRQEQLDDLLNNVSQVSDADFANVKALINGEVNYFMGFEFVQTQTVDSMRKSSSSPPRITLGKFGQSRTSAQLALKKKALLKFCAIKHLNLGGKILWHQ